MPSHKPLKSVSHNFVHSFISLINYINDDYFLGHLLKQVRKTKLNKLTVNILKNKTEPNKLITKQIKTSIEHWNKRFPALVENSGSTMAFVKDTKLSIEFDLQQEISKSGNKESMKTPFICEMVIIDDSGKEYKYLHEGWWFYEIQ